MFKDWGGKKKATASAIITKTAVQDWRPLLQEEDLCVEFRFLGRELEINAFLHVNSTIARVIEVLTLPDERKKWDIRLQDMISLPQNGGYIFIYANERKLYEFHSIVKSTQTEIQGSVEFNTLCYELKMQNTVFGQFSSVYTAGVLEEFEAVERYDPKGNPIRRLKVSWKAHFCEASFELVKGDIFQEADILRKSCQLMINLAEFRDEVSSEALQAENNLLETFERKKLASTLSGGHLSA